jgi:hypothetical protein
MQLDLLGPPGRRSGCRPHDGEVAAVAISFSRNCCSPIPVRGDDGARAVGASIDHEAAAAPAEISHGVIDNRSENLQHRQ